MIIGAIIAVCVVLLVLAFVAPRLSRRPQGEVDRGLGAGGRDASHAPGPLGRWLQKAFAKSAKAVDRSAGSGRRAREKLPL